MGIKRISDNRMPRTVIEREDQTRVMMLMLMLMHDGGSGDAVGELMPCRMFLSSHFGGRSRACSLQLDG
jgi:hypothetical protein